MRQLVYSFLLLALPTALSAQTLVKDINPGQTSSSPEQLLAINGTLFFLATDPAHGQELWKTDGTQQGTVLIRDIAPGPTGAQIKDLINLNGTLYFSAVSTLPNHEKRQLWKSDGTEAGTVDLPDGHKDGEMFDVLGLTKVGNTLFYIKRAALGGNDNWALYRAEAGNPETESLYFFPTFEQPAPRLGESNGLLYIAYKNELFKIDPLSGGKIPTLVKTGVNVHQMASYQKTLYFSAGFLASELWTSQGTEATTHKIASVNKGQIYDLRKAGEYLFFTAGQEGKELWVSKGEPASTRLIGTFAFQPKNITSLFTDFTIAGRSPVYFTVSNESTLYYTLGGPPLKVTGNFTGAIQNLTNMQGTLYCTTGDGLYRIQGGINKAVQVLATKTPVSNLAELKGSIYFSYGSNVAIGTELYSIPSSTIKSVNFK